MDALKTEFESKLLALKGELKKDSDDSYQLMKQKLEELEKRLEHFGMLI